MTSKRKQYTPETDKIAVKMINHDGDEVMKVLEVDTARRSCCRRKTFRLAWARIGQES